MATHSTFSDHAALLRDFIRRHAHENARAASAAEFNQFALSSFARQFTQIPDYRIFCDGRDAAPETINHWSEIPAIPTAAFKEFELTSLPPGQRQLVFHSSGTTEHRPAHHFHDAESLALYEASLLPWFKRHLLPGLADSATSASHFSLSPPRGEGQGEGWFRLVSLTPPPELAPHSSLVHMFATIHRELGSAKSRFAGRVEPDGSWAVDYEQTLAHLRGAIADGEPVTVMGTAFNFVQLLDQLEHANVRLTLPAGSRALETGGYKGRSRSLPKGELHALIEAKLGILSTYIVSEYGMCELSSQAYDLEVQSPSAFAPATADKRSKVQSLPRAFRFPPWARVQVFSPETGLEVAEGETGLIRVFDLANLRSVLAIQTEDLGVRRGDGFELLGRATLAEARGCSLMSI